MQIILDVADRVEVPFQDMIDSYRNDLIQRNRFAREIRNNPEYSDFRDIEFGWPFYNHHTVKVLKVEEGHGLHVHDKSCNYGKADNRRFGDKHPRPCTAYFDDSDWIVTLSYSPVNSDKVHWAQYGVTNGRFYLWAD